MKYILDGEIIHGDEMDVIEYMKTNEFNPERFESVIDYLEHVQKNMFKFFSKSIVLEGETEREICNNFVAQMVEHGLIEMDKDTKV